MRGFVDGAGSVHIDVRWANSAVRVASQVSEGSMKALLAVIAAFCLSACATASAQQQAQPAPCAAPEFRQLDFWVGVWDARWEAAQGIAAGSGANTITREYADCVIQEQFDGGPATGGLIGHSVSTYHAPAQVWRQTWVDNQGGYFALAGGPVGEDFILTSYRLNTATPTQRMVFTDITETSFTWRWQLTPDAGATWNDSWVIHYTRRTD
jgi:hypothetical protein